MIIQILSKNGKGKSTVALEVKRALDKFFTVKLIDESQMKGWDSVENQNKRMVSLRDQNLEVTIVTKNIAPTVKEQCIVDTMVKGTEHFRGEKS